MSILFFILLRAVLWVSGCESCWFSKLDVLGACFSCANLKKKKILIEAPHVGSAPLHLREGPGFEFSLRCGSCQPGVWLTEGLCSSLCYPDLMWLVYCLSNAALSFSQPSGFAFLRRNCCFCSCRLTCLWGQVSSGAN